MYWFLTMVIVCEFLSLGLSDVARALVAIEVKFNRKKKAIEADDSLLTYPNVKNVLEEEKATKKVVMESDGGFILGLSMLVYLVAVIGLLFTPAWIVGTVAVANMLVRSAARRIAPNAYLKSFTCVHLVDSAICMGLAAYYILLGQGVV